MTRFRFRMTAALQVLTITTLPLAVSPASAVVPGSTSATNTDKQNLAMHGYDAVAYFTEGQPTLGDPQFSSTFGGGRYQFASEANLKAFEVNPAAYAPQFGGFCALGAAYGEKVDADPTAWQIVNGKLYLNHNASVAKRWQKNIPGNIARAEGKWSDIRNNPQ